jgi:hypothetical protein
LNFMIFMFIKKIVIAKWFKDKQTNNNIII